VNDSTAMLFNLTTHQLFKSQDHSKAIYCGKGYGPRFGDSLFRDSLFGELAANEPFNGDNKCWSFSNSKGYRI
jgi:hypothetical protein